MVMVMEGEGEMLIYVMMILLEVEERVMDVCLEKRGPPLSSPARVAGVYLVKFSIRNLSYKSTCTASNLAAQSFCSM